MKILSFHFTIFLFACMASVQAQSLFEKKYLQSTYYQYVKADKDGNIYCAGTNYNRTQIVIAKIDSSGNVLWDKLTGIPNAQNWGHDMLLLGDSMIVVLCSWDRGSASTFVQPYIICIDTSGNTIYTKSIGDTLTDYYVPFDLISDSLGYIISMNDGKSASINYNATILVKFDKNGNMYYARALNNTVPSAISTGRYIHRGNNGNYLLYGSRYGITTVNKNFMNPQQTFTLYWNGDNRDLYIYSILSASDTDFYFAGGIHPQLHEFVIGHINSKSECDWIKKN